MTSLRRSPEGTESGEVLKAEVEVQDEPPLVRGRRSGYDVVVAEH